MKVTSDAYRDAVADRPDDDVRTRLPDPAGVGSTSAGPADSSGPSPVDSA